MFSGPELSARFNHGLLEAPSAATSLKRRVKGPQTDYLANCFLLPMEFLKIRGNEALERLVDPCIEDARGRLYIIVPRKKTIEIDDIDWHTDGAGDWQCTSSRRPKIGA
jgi:hypothetical protein